MKKMNKLFLSDIADNFDYKRVPLSAKQRLDIKRIYPYYGAQNIIDYVDDYLFDGEYILVAEDGENLRSQNAKICNLVKGKFWVNNHAHIIRAKDNNNTRYLFYYLNLLDFNPFITGSAQPKLTQDNLNSIALNIHGTDDQKIIADTLSVLDSKIEINLRINTELEQLTKTLYYLWFVQFDFPNQHGKPYKSSGGTMIWNEKLKRKIPEHWRYETLGSIVTLGKDQVDPQNNPDTAFRHYSIPNFDETGSYVLEKGSTIKSNKFMIQKYDVLVSKLNPWFSRIVYAQNEDNQISSTEFVVWRPEDLSTKNYLYMMAKDNAFIQYCVQSSSGTSHSHKRVNPEVMMDYGLAYNQEVISNYGDLINSLLSKYFTNTKQNIMLSSLRDWLLPMLMNGQVKVN